MLAAGRLSAVLAATLLLAGSALAQITIQTVPVGNAGNAADTASHSGNPAGQGHVNYEYGIGKHEVTAGQYTAFLNAVAVIDTYALYNTSMWSVAQGCKIQRSSDSGSYTYSVAADYADRPVNFVSFGDSMRFANWLHNGQPTGAQNAATTEDGAYLVNAAITETALLVVTRKASWKWAVTSEDEWYKAAYHKNDGMTGNYFRYPTSSDSIPGRSLAHAPGNNANIYGTPFPIDSPYYTTLAGEFENSGSPYDTFDQGGNVWELNEAIISGSFRGMRGGSFLDMYNNLMSGGRNHLLPTIEDSAIGFRVAEVPEPASIGLLALGAMALLARRGA